MLVAFCAHSFIFKNLLRNTERLVGYAKESSRLAERDPLEPVYISYSLTDIPRFISLFVEHKNNHGQKENSTARKTRKYLFKTLITSPAIVKRIPIGVWVPSYDRLNRCIPVCDHPSVLDRNLHGICRQNRH